MVVIESVKCRGRKSTKWTMCRAAEMKSISGFLVNKVESGAKLCRIYAQPYGANRNRCNRAGANVCSKSNPTRDYGNLGRTEGKRASSCGTGRQGTVIRRRLQNDQSGIERWIDGCRMKRSERPRRHRKAKERQMKRLKQAQRMVGAHNLKN